MMYVTIQKEIQGTESQINFFSSRYAKVQTLNT